MVGVGRIEPPQSDLNLCTERLQSIGLDRSNATEERKLRRDVGINHSDFVFCSFNAASKFDPRTFKVSIILRILLAPPLSNLV
jgi:predicted O-linked N-acetylglucosamine transferase (SPINDLY family)